MSRLHDRTFELIAEDRTHLGLRRWLLWTPSPGWFRAAAAPMAWCGPRTTIGTLDVLGRRHLLVTPPGIAGFADNFLSGEPLVSSLSSRAVAYRDPIVILSSDPMLGGHGDAAEPAGAASAATTTSAADAHGLVFRAPTSGRFYGRSAPDKPPFVTEGTQLTHGATICLLEVMKTFHRVTYSGPGLPDAARVIRVLVVEGADVNAGDPLLALG